MTTLYSNEYQEQYVGVPSVRIDMGKVASEVKTMVCTRTMATGEGNADTIYLGKLPKGVRIINAQIATDHTANVSTDVGFSGDIDALIDGFNANTKKTGGMYENDAAGPIAAGLMSEGIVTTQEEIVALTFGGDASGSINGKKYTVIINYVSN